MTVETREVETGEIPEVYRDGLTSDYVEISVTDTGCGIEPEALKHIFDPFFTTKRKGTGLGLAVVKNILVGHGGFILADSEKGRGSRFRLYFPTTKLPVARLDEGRESGAGGGREFPSFWWTTTGQICQISEKTAGLAGPTGVEAYTDAREAMAVLGRGDRDWQILVTDDTMPNLRGASLARRAKQRDGIQVILLTGTGGAGHDSHEGTGNRGRDCAEAHSI